MNDTQESWCTRYITPKNGMGSGSHHLFEFWEISDNILEMMQHRDIVAMEDY